MRVVRSVKQTLEAEAAPGLGFSKGVGGFLRFGGGGVTENV